MSLTYKVLGVAAVALAALTSRADAGTLSGKLTDMFSGAPYNGATITAVNESTQEAYDATSGPNATAVQPESWGRIKRNFNIIVPSAGSRKRGQLENTLNEGFYTLDLPDGDYTVAFTDGNPGSAKPTSGDLANLQIDSNDRFYPRTVLGLDVRGNREFDESLVPRAFDMEYAWTVLNGTVNRYDFDRVTFYVDIGPARNKNRSDPNGVRPSQSDIDVVLSSINDFVRLETGGTKLPRIEVGTTPPDFVSNPKGGLMVPSGVALVYWESGLPQGVLGTGVPWANESTGEIGSSLVRLRPGVATTFPGIVSQEIMGAGGLHGEPGSNLDLDRRVRDTGGSIFLDLDGVSDVSSPTQRDLQIIQFHGQRPLLTKPVDVTEVPFESAQ